MGEAEISVSNERKMLHYHKGCCMVIETCTEGRIPESGKEKRFYFLLLVILQIIDSMSSIEDFLKTSCQRK
jgi:hypothetical protein